MIDTSYFRVGSDGSVSGGKTDRFTTTSASELPAVFSALVADLQAQGADFLHAERRGTTQFTHTVAAGSVAVNASLPEGFDAMVDALAAMALAEQSLSTPPVLPEDAVRATRDALLGGTDWTQLPDAPVDVAVWRVYRQALRDIPQQPGFPENVVWPLPPA